MSSVSIQVSYTGNSITYWQPPVGKKWNILSVHLRVVTGATAGTRYASVSRYINESLLSVLIPAEDLADIGSFSTVNSSVDANLSGSGSANGGTTNVKTKYSDVWITAYDRIGFSYNVLAGDTVYYDVVVDEVIDI